MEALALAKLIQLSDKSKYQAVLEYQHLLWEKLFGIEITPKTKVTSPLRADNNPGCFFWWTDKWIYFVDFADEPTHRNIIDFTKEYFGYDFYQAVDFLHKLLTGDRNIELKQLKREINSKQRLKVIKTKQDNWTEKHLQYWERYGIDPFLTYFVANFEIIPLKEWENEYKKIITPLAFKYQFSNGEYKIYSPYSKKYKWRSNVSKSTIGWIHKKKLSYKEKRILFITKSIKDGIILAELYPTIIFQSETAFPNWSVLANTIGRGFEKFIVIFDRDNTGIKQANKLKLQLKYRFSQQVDMIIPLEKDIAEMSLKIGKINTIKWVKRNLLEQMIN